MNYANNSSSSIETAIEEKSTGQRPRAHARWVWQSISTVVSSLTLVILALVISYLTVGSAPKYRAPESCGSSVDEARSLGCSFDVMSFSWLPSRCYDRQLTRDFLALKKWEWFMDSEGQVLADRNLVEQGAYEELYVTQEYHRYHCTYMWRKMHRAVQRRQPLDGYIGNTMHTGHCEQLLVNVPSSLDVINTTIFSKFVKCPFGGEELKDRGWYRLVEGVMVYGYPNISIR